MDSPAALQLRYLQTLNSISAEHNSTIIFPVPIDIVSNFMNYQQAGETPPQDSSQYQEFLQYQQTLQAQHSFPPQSQAARDETEDCSLKHLVGSDLTVT